MKKRRFLGIIAGLMMISLIGGCNSFFNTGSSGDGTGIAEVNHELVPDGVQVTILFEDDSKDPVVFIIPKGTAGVDGNSIQSIAPGHDDQGNLTITISYTDPSMDPLTIPIPSNKGIKEIHPAITSEGNTEIVIEYTDGSLSNPITIFKGETGLSIIDAYPELQPDGSTNMIIVMNDEGHTTYSIPVPPGNGIESIDPSQTDDKYVLTITYTSGNQVVVEYDKPNRWHQVTAKPGNGDYNDGDFAFDMVGHIIYTKQNGAWIEVANLNTDDSIRRYQITFDLNANDATLTRGQLGYTIPEGKTIYSEGHTMPETVRDGFNFKGWCTVKEPTVVNGWFTDLTPVVSDMTLYAVWEEQVNP